MLALSLCMCVCGGGGGGDKGLYSPLAKSVYFWFPSQMLVIFHTVRMSEDQKGMPVECTAPKQREERLEL